MSEQRHGVVVVGVGRAGSGRIRDLNNFNSHAGLNWSLKGFVSRRQLEIEGVKQITLEECLSSDEVTMLVICTEPGHHEKVIRQALDCGKHVLVEFPLTLSTQTTKELYDLAAQKSLVLHEEDIALLLPSLTETKNQLESHKIQNVDICLTGNYNGWIEEIDRGGAPFSSSISLLQEMYELFGDLEVIGGQLQLTEEDYMATANLLTKDKKPITLKTGRSKVPVARKKVSKFTFEDGTVYEPYNPGPPKPQPGAEKRAGLMMKDFFHFVEKVKGDLGQDEDRSRTLHCMEMADKIHSFMK